MPDQFESGIINSYGEESWNSPAIATIICLDPDYSDAQLASPGLFQRLTNIVPSPYD
jgi:hypothetical protein